VAYCVLPKSSDLGFVNIFSLNEVTILVSVPVPLAARSKA
jgi:hypothetical protein